MKGRDVVFSHKSDEWETPKWLFDIFDANYHFTLDPCATSENTKCEKFYTIEEDGLSKSWSGESVWVNPPYSNIREWAQKCKSEAWGGEQAPNGFPKNRTIISLLVPARTDTKWFHEVIHSATEITFIKGRLHFNNSENSAPFPSVVITFDVPNWTGHCRISTLQTPKRL
jgi:site-specific DNA-methyltransferase (adenine-specific)